MIRTFIFCDLETTGLIGKNCMPKVTEMALVAVSRSDICDTTEYLPRVLHKLVLPINPNVNVSKGIETLTGLSNNNLADVQCFNCDIYNLVMSFISRQTAPTCLVAYNGNRFDYPILLSEITNIQKNFSDNILSIDMYHLVKDFFSNKQDTIKKGDIAPTASSTLSNSDVSSLLNDGYDKILSDALDSIMNTNLNNCDRDNSLVLKNKETMSDCCDTPSSSQSMCLKKMQEINEKTPENQIIKIPRSGKNVENKKVTTARRKLSFATSQPTNFKLSSICKHMLGTDPENVHSAEGDCLTMIRCATQLRSFFVEWADVKAQPINNFKSL